MRYYIYLDKEFLQILFSVFENANFDIEVIEYSERKNYGGSNDLSISPGIENISETECDIDKDIKEREKRRNKCENLNKEHLGISYAHNNSFNIQTEKRYINIEDISNMKNNAFYHKLINMMNEEMKKEDTRVMLETGIICEYNNEALETEIDGFFIINNNYIWLDKRKLKGNINLLCKMNCRTNVIGYRMNCDLRDDNRNILKAIAIFIE